MVNIEINDNRHFPSS